MNQNIVIIDNQNNSCLNFKHLLTCKDSLILRKCSNIKITIKSKINKLIFDNCNNIKIKISDTISGIEFNKCKNIKLKTRRKQSINIIECYKTNIEIFLYSGQDKEIDINSEDSNVLIKIID